MKEFVQNIINKNYTKAQEILDMRLSERAADVVEVKKAELTKVILKK
jgi:hypothetical protein